MADKVIMLAHTAGPKHPVTYPCYVSEKIDGVAADFYIPLGSNSGDVLVRSRQDKPILSVQHICDYLKSLGVLIPGMHLICELYIPRREFKDTSGRVRSHVPCPDIKALVYDAYVEGFEHEPFEARLEIMRMFARATVSPVDLMRQEYVRTETHLDAVKKYYEESEGIMIRTPNGPYEKKRSKHMLKMKWVETLDLAIHSIEEAIDQDGNPKGMAGRINVHYKDTVIGVGPGNSDHHERTNMWINRDAMVGRIIEVKYMPDPSYDALREPRFVQFRDDKTEPNEE